MTKKIYRTCICMSQKEHAMLREKSKAAGLTMNKYLMQQLEEKRPWMNREPESMEFADHLNRAGKEINVIARDFNSGFGTEEQLNQAVALLKEVYVHACKVREKGYLQAS